VPKKTSEKIKKNIADSVDKQVSPLGKKEGRILSTKEVCETFAIPNYDLKKMREKGCPHYPDPRNSRAFIYNSAELLKWIKEQEQADLKAQIQTQEIELNNAIEEEEAERRFKVARALREEHALALERALVGNVDDILLNIRVSVENARGSIVAWKNELPSLFAYKSEQELEDLFDREVERILNILNGYQHTYEESAPK